MTKSDRKRQVIESEAIIALLAATYPKCFSVVETRRKPLVIGIHVELQRALDGAVTPIELSHALRHYAGNQVYLQRMVAWTWRIGLDGQPCGSVTKEEEQWTFYMEDGNHSS